MKHQYAVDLGTEAGTAAAQAWVDDEHPTMDEVNARFSMPEAFVPVVFTLKLKTPGQRDAYQKAYDAAGRAVLKDLLERLAWILRPIPEPGSVKRTFTPMGPL